MHTLARLDPHAFVRLRVVHVFAHLVANEIDAIPREAWAGMDQTLSVLLSLGRVLFQNTCKDVSHVSSGWAMMVEQLPVLRARGILRLSKQVEETGRLR